MTRILALGLAVVVAACTRAGVPPDSAAARPVDRAQRLDPAQARRLCSNADSVIAGRADCVMLDQSAPPPASPLPPR